MDFHGKRVVLTGGSNGIGLALATALASGGATVTSLDVAAPAQKIDGVTHVHCDVSKLDDVRMALAQAGGTIDLLIVNAGVMRRGPVLSHPDDEFDLLFGVNAKGTWLMLKEGLPLLSPHAVVLHVSSYRAGQDVDDPGLYAASKAAAEHLVRCAARSQPHLTVKTSRLGPTDTAMSRHQVEGEALKKKEAIMLPASDVAAMLLELAAGTHASLSYDPARNTYAFDA